VVRGLLERVGVADQVGFAERRPGEGHTQFDPQICVLTFKHVHSGTAPVDTSFTHTTFNNIGDPRYDGRVFTTPAANFPAMFPAGTSVHPARTNTGKSEPNAGEGTDQHNHDSFGGSAGIIEMWYHFVVRGEGHNFTFAFVNSAGPVKEGIGTGSPGLISLGDYNNPAKTAERAWAAAIGKGLFDIMDNLPRTDVLLGSIVSLGAAANQQRDIIMYQQHLRPKVYYPGHLTDVAQAGSALYHKLSWQQTAYNMGFVQSDWPEFRLQIDPNDFMVPQVFNPKDDRWNKSSAQEDRIKSMCR